VFPFVYTIKGDALIDLSTELAQLGFIHDNIVYHHGVNDLLCTWQPV
jgi:hypothetical protein